jgi:hypothetical protein
VKRYSTILLCFFGILAFGYLWLQFAYSIKHPLAFLEAFLPEKLYLATDFSQKAVTLINAIFKLSIFVAGIRWLDDNNMIVMNHLLEEGQTTAYNEKLREALG